jgi:hypothetical protein
VRVGDGLGFEQAQEQPHGSTFRNVSRLISPGAQGNRAAGVARASPLATVTQERGGVFPTDCQLQCRLAGTLPEQKQPSFESWAGALTFRVYFFS